LTPVVETEQIATKADLKQCQVAKAAERSEHRDEEPDGVTHQSEKALKVGAVAVGVAATMAGLAKAMKA